ncbi:MAG: winged helix-turn-helix domain-containing protein [Actinomycetota bacterium]
MASTASASARPIGPIGSSVASDLARFAGLLADQTRTEILCALMDGRAHTGSELARHVGVAPSTTSEHLSKLLDGGVVAVEAQGRHRYWRLADRSTAELLEHLGASASPLGAPAAPAGLRHARTCYDHLAGELAVAIYERMVADGHLVPEDDRVVFGPSGYELLAGIGGDPDAVRAARRPTARACLDWTQRRHHLAGAAGTAFLDALLANDWIRRGTRPRSVMVTERGRVEIRAAFRLG